MEIAGDSEIIPIKVSHNGSKVTHFKYPFYLGNEMTNIRHLINSNIWSHHTFNALLCYKCDVTTYNIDSFAKY